MSGKIKNILLLVICILTEFGCQKTMVPAGYHRTPKQISKSIAGGWVELSVIPDPSNDTITMLSGELLAVGNDTFHILTARDGLISLNENRISTVELYFFSNPNISVLGFLGVIPNIIGAFASPENAGYFLLMGIPLVATSSAMALSDKGNSKLRYPVKNRLSEFSQYSRFPQGLPPDLQKEKLHLIYQYF